MSGSKEYRSARRRPGHVRGCIRSVDTPGVAASQSARARSSSRCASYGMSSRARVSRTPECVTLARTRQALHAGARRHRPPSECRACLTNDRSRTATDDCLHSERKRAEATKWDRLLLLLVRVAGRDQRRRWLPLDDGKRGAALLLATSVITSEGPVETCVRARAGTGGQVLRNTRPHGCCFCRTTGGAATAIRLMHMADLES